MSPRVLLRVEGLALLALSLYAYSRVDGSWLFFIALVLAPDLSILGYLAGPRTGAATYNLVHTYTLPLALGAYGLSAGHQVVIRLALIWLAHIGADRSLGFGLKYPTAFKDTHLDRV